MKDSGLIQIEGAPWYCIHQAERIDPFLMSLVSDEDHWMFIASNGGLTAGRGSSGNSLFPYYTQDKLIDLAHTTGPQTLIRLSGENGSRKIWQPFLIGNETYPRKLLKKADGTQVSFEETHTETGLEFSYTWGFSQELGFVRKATLRNTSDQTIDLELIDGLQNLLPSCVDPEFQNAYSNLLDAYKRCEHLPEGNLRLIYLNSVPTDRAEPSECLSCTTVWSSGLPSPDNIFNIRKTRQFLRGEPLEPEQESRGLRPAVFDCCRLSLEGGKSIQWHFVAEVNQSVAEASRLQHFLVSHSASDLAEKINRDLQNTSTGLTEKVASADGLQLTGDPLRTGRHFSNVMFNIMRGGCFPYGYRVPKKHFMEYISRSNSALFEKFSKELEELPEWIDRSDLESSMAALGDPGLLRLTLEYLPLSFSRRHGDPSRPWNKFSIRVRDGAGEPILSYQGNWRDIFQNWETLSYSYPGYLEGIIARFLNASTADGYNPYRLTSEGFEWEVLDPEEPWSNIGYWGDHQLIYLLRLLEALRNFFPGNLHDILGRELYAYAWIPYRIRNYKDILKSPRNSISYDEEAENRIEERVKQLGSDGCLLPDAKGNNLLVSMLEKLLVPLLTKLSNLVPDGGIWMNTQRPEWNDANNALAGFGLSVVTLAYSHRYIVFLEELLNSLSGEEAFDMSKEVARLLREQSGIFAEFEGVDNMDGRERRDFMDRMGLSASHFRDNLYNQGLSGQKEEVTVSAVLHYLASARKCVAASLRANKRQDNLYHSYNLLKIEDSGEIHINHLYEMLEGQVAILSSKLLSTSEMLDILEALPESRLYRADQESYLLYPDRDLPGFMERNKISSDAVERSRLIQMLLEDTERRIVEKDDAGNVSFSGSFRNANELKSALNTLPGSYASISESEREELVELFEEVFNHHSFTGRSGTFFAYEGLGSIYWHMVSKLLLATGELGIAASREGDLARRVRNHFHAILAGLGIWKSPESYGAFPIDAYSHTPRHAGAQQPGMTGQVKEDILSRWLELGLTVKDGTIRFNPVLLKDEEYLPEAATFPYSAIDGHPRAIELEQDSLAFTFCQVPVVYQRGAEASITVIHSDGTREKIDGNNLPAELSRKVFLRTGKIDRLEVTVA